MPSPFIRIWCLVAVAAMATIAVLAADEKTGVALTAQQVMPGAQAYVTVMLTNNPSVDVGQIQQRIEFPKDKISYVSTRTSIAGDLSEAELKAEIQEAKGDAEKGGNLAVLVLSIKGKRPIPDGPVAEITFMVPATLAEQTIKLGHKAEASSPDGKKIDNLVFEDGSLKVTKEVPVKPPAIMSCFFYMH